MKLFKPLYIHNVEYTGVNFIKSSRKGYKSYKRHNCIAIYPYSDEARLVEELADKVKSRVQWLVDWLYANIRPTSSVYKIDGTMLSLAIDRVAQAKVRKDWEAYTSAILNLNTLYIYALEARYDRPCGYTDSTVVIGCNRWGWREGFTLPKQRPFGKLKEIA